MPFIMLQMASVFVGTIIFLLHSTNVNKKIDYAETENTHLRDELTDASIQIEQLQTEISSLKLKLAEINSISCDN
jgi:hypothetical protein